MKERVKWHLDERVDQPDLEAMTDLTEAETRRIMSMMAAPDLTAIPTAATNHNPYAVLESITDGIVYEPESAVRVTVKAGLKLALAADDTGDILDLDADVLLEGYCPTEAIPTKLLMARVKAARVDSDVDQRIFYDEETEGEVEDTVPTREITEIEWQWADFTVEQDILDYMTAGYQWVALMTLSNDEFATKWFYILPKTGDTDAAPGMGSVTQVLHAMAKQLGRIIRSGEVEHPRWLTTPAISLNTLSTFKSATEAFIAIASDAIATLQGEMASATARILALEKRRMVAQFYFQSHENTNPPEFYSMVTGVDTGIEASLGTYSEQGVYQFILKEAIADLDLFVEAHYKLGLEHLSFGVDGKVCAMACGTTMTNEAEPRPCIEIQMGYWDGDTWVGVNAATYQWIEVCAWAIS